METKNRIFYEPPTTDVLEVKNEGIICASDPTNLGASFNDYQEGTFTW